MKRRHQGRPQRRPGESDGDGGDDDGAAARRQPRQPSEVRPALRLRVRPLVLRRRSRPAPDRLLPCPRPPPQTRRPLHRRESHQASKEAPLTGHSTKSPVSRPPLWPLLPGLVRPVVGGDVSSGASARSRSQGTPRGMCPRPRLPGGQPRSQLLFLVRWAPAPPDRIRLRVRVPLRELRIPRRPGKKRQRHLCAVGLDRDEKQWRSGLRLHAVR